MRAPPRGQGTPTRGGGREEEEFAVWLAELRAFESGIDPELFEWYRSHLHRPSLTYPPVTEPGHVRRDFHTGSWSERLLTVQEYFEALGVADWFDDTRQECLRLMQYRSMNFLGFVGYQIGESILISSGHYIAERRSTSVEGETSHLESYYYGGLPSSCWSRGHTHVPFCIPGTSKWILASHVNYWRGKFTGKDGVHSLSDLMIPDKQEAVLRTIMRYNYDTVRGELERLDLRFDEVLRERSSDLQETITASGILAAAHLCGPEATACFLATGSGAVDELGTTIEQYVRRFSGAATPFDP